MTNPQAVFEELVCSFTEPSFDDLLDLLSAHHDEIDMNATGRVPYTAMERACAHGRLDVVKALVGYGADIDVQSRLVIDGVTIFVSPPPIVYAMDYIEIFEYFLGQGAQLLYTLDPASDAKEFSVVSVMMIKYGLNWRVPPHLLQSIAKALRLSTPFLSTAQKNVILQTILRYHRVYFRHRFMQTLAECAISFDASFDFFDMEQLPVRHNNAWWGRMDIISHLLARCGETVLFKIIYDPRCGGFFTLRALFLTTPATTAPWNTVLP
jgi:hypothetical protein